MGLSFIVVGLHLRPVPKFVSMVKQATQWKRFDVLTLQKSQIEDRLSMSETNRRKFERLQKRLYLGHAINKKIVCFARLPICRIFSALISCSDV